MFFKRLLGGFVGLVAGCIAGAFSPITSMIATTALLPKEMATWKKVLIGSIVGLITSPLSAIAAPFIGAVGGPSRVIRMVIILV